MKKVNPAATVQVIFTGEWSLPVREAEATNALVDAGCDVITCHVDRPKVVVETAEERGVKTCGHNANQAPLAPKGFITGAEQVGDGLHDLCRRDDRQGREAAERQRGRLRQGHGAATPPSVPAPPEGIKAAEAAIDDLKAASRFCRPAQGQQGQRRHRGNDGQLRPGARRHELPARRRAGLAHLIAASGRRAVAAALDSATLLRQ